MYRKKMVVSKRNWEGNRIRTNIEMGKDGQEEALRFSVCPTSCSAK